jgi:hypothetical protein
VARTYNLGNPGAWAGVRRAKSLAEVLPEEDHVAAVQRFFVESIRHLKEELRAFYRFTPFNSQHFADLERVVTTNQQDLAALRERSIDGVSDEDTATVEGLFGDFEQLLGPVGAAKALHLLAPQFFPLWDRAIAKAYGLPLRERGKNADRYLRFMQITKQQYEALAGEHIMGQNLLKVLDEYNYSHYTKHWT